MCSVNWRQFGDTIGIVFNRDESVLRTPALPPQRFAKGGVEFVMPIDPDGGGSWITMNSAGLVLFILNDYQGVMKPPSSDLVSRGLLLKSLASCSDLAEVEGVLQQWPLSRSQPFYLGCISNEQQLMWHFDGKPNNFSKVARLLPNQWYSSGHPEAAEIYAARQAYVDEQEATLRTLDELITLHQSHYPHVHNDRAYSLCMHRPEARSQSLTSISLGHSEVEMTHWQGQPCEMKANEVAVKSLVLSKN
jgi:hypothetical protein